MRSSVPALTLSGSTFPRARSSWRDCGLTRVRFALRGFRAATQTCWTVTIRSEAWPLSSGTSSRPQSVTGNWWVL